MVFFLTYIYSVLYTYCLGQAFSRFKVSSAGLFLLLSPVIVVWLIVCGGQYQVGTDYWSYRYIFEGNDLDYYLQKNEYIFVWIVSLFNILGIYGQGLFYVFYAISFYFFFLILKRMPKMQYFLFILLYITVSNLFNNQLNTLRQSVTIYIGTYVAFLVFENKNIKAILFILVAILIHQSAFSLFLLFLNKILVQKLSMNDLFVGLIIAVILSFTLRVEILDMFSDYSNINYVGYINSGVIEERSLFQKITKYMFIPIYLLSFFYFKRNSLGAYELLLFKWGWVSLCLRIGILNLELVSRLFSCFLILSILPLLLYLYHLIYRRKFVIFLCVITFLSVVYFFKTIVFGRGEYLYESIYF